VDVRYFVEKNTLDLMIGFVSSPFQSEKDLNGFPKIALGKSGT
jgi:hypothetical protein